MTELTLPTGPLAATLPDLQTSLDKTAAAFQNQLNSVLSNSLNESQKKYVRDTMMNEFNAHITGVEITNPQEAANKIWRELAGLKPDRMDEPTFLQQTLEQARQIVPVK